MPRVTKGRRPKGKAGLIQKLSSDGYPCSPYPHPLKPQHAVFLDHYMRHFNGSKAALEAGFSKRSAGQLAYEVLKRHEVRAEITRRRWAASQQIGGITRERFDRELERVALADMGDFAPMFGDGDLTEKLGMLTRDQSAVVQSITVEEFRDGRTSGRQVRRTKFTLAPKAKGLELLGRSKGWIVDKIDHKHDHRHSVTVLHALLSDISAMQEGRPIVDPAEGAEPVEAIVESSGEAA